MAKNAPKLAVISQARQSSSTNTNNSHSDNDNDDTITVVVCPKSTAAIRLADSDKQNPYPYYERLCNKYGFSLDVEIIYQQPLSSSLSSKSSCKRVSGGGPKTTHFVLSNNGGNNTTAYTPAKLQYHSERLIIVPPPSSRAKSSVEQLRPDFQPGDILQSIDGIQNPTFDMVYAVMMRNDKLLLEIKRRNNNGVSSSSRRNSSGRRVSSLNSCALVQNGNVERANPLVHPIQLEQLQQTTTSSTATSTTTSSKATTTSTKAKKKRQVPAWDAENRRVQKEQRKLLQREQDKTSQKQKKARQRAELEHSSNNSTTASATTSTSTATTTSTSTAKVSTSRKSNKQQQQHPQPSSSKSSSTINNVHSPSFLQKAVARSSENLQEFNRLQKEDEMAMYGEHNLMLLDHTLMNNESGDEGGGSERQRQGVDDEVVKELNPDGGCEKELSVATVPTAALTIDNDGYGDDSLSLVYSVTSSNDNPLILDDHPMQCTNNAGDDKQSYYPRSDSSSSVPSSSSSSSSSSVPSSSSSSSSCSSSSSDSNSSKNANCKSDNKTSIIHPPRTIATTAASSMTTTPPRKSSHHIRFNQSSESIANTAKVVKDQLLPVKRSRLSSIASQDVGGKTYPTYSSGTTINNRSRPNTTKKSGSTEAPTSLGRLWPDPSDIVKALTSWQPPSATVKQRRVEFYGSVNTCSLVSSMRGGRGGDFASSSNPLLQDTVSTSCTNSKQYNEFKNVDEMMDGLARPLMDEGLASINNEYNSNKFKSGMWNRDTYRLIVIKITPVTPIFTKESSFFGEHVKLYEIQFSLKGETRIPPSNLSELYCLHYHRWRSCKMGIVGHDFPTTITFRSFSESNSILKLFVCVDETLKSGDSSTEGAGGRTGWLSKDEFRALYDPHKFGVPHPNAVLTLMSVGSTTNIVRQFEAIASIGHLKRKLCI